MHDFWLSLICYLSAYVIVTIIGMLHTIFNIYVLHYKPMKESSDMGEAYERTKPFHPLYNVIIFPLFAWLYFSLTGNTDVSEALWLSLLWGTLTIIIDLVGWVIIKHPWSLTFRQFYVEYQPWISLVYLTIYASPFISYAILQLF